MLITNFARFACTALVFLSPGKSDGQNFLQVFKGVAPDVHSFSYLGSSTAISGNTAIVGAPEFAGPGLAGIGNAYVYERDSIRGWGLKSVLFASDSATSSMFGSSVCLSDSYAIIGAYLAEITIDGQRIPCGAAYVFERDATGAWNQVQKLTPTDERRLMFFGYSVSESGNYAIIGVDG